MVSDGSLWRQSKPQEPQDSPRPQDLVPCASTNVSSGHARPLNAANRWLSLEHSSNGASPEGRLPSAQHRPSAVALRVKPYCFVRHAQETCLTSAVFFNLTNRYCTFSHQLPEVSKVDQTHFGQTKNQQPSHMLWESRRPGLPLALCATTII